MAADVVEGEQGAVVPVQHDLPAFGHDRGRRVVRQFGVLKRAGPAARPGGPGDPVDHHALGEDEMTAEVAGRAGDREAGRGQRAGGAPVAGHPAAQGGTLQPEGHRVEQAVHQPDAAVLLLADRPVGDAGDRGRDRGHDPGRAEHAGGVQAAARRRVTVRHVQHDDTRPQPDGQVGQGGVDRVPGPPAAVHQFHQELVLVPFAQRHQRGGQLVAQLPEPAELVDLGYRVAVPADQERGTST